MAADTQYDVIIIGTGAGGGTLAYALAPTGKRILLLACGDQWLAYLKGFQTEPGGTYPHESVVEVYDSGTLPYIEIEVHSPLIILNPGASYGYTETWVLGWLPEDASVEHIRRWVMPEESPWSRG